jgi:hypothetical protein
MPWPDPPLHPTKPDPDYDNPTGPDHTDSREALASLGVGNVGQMNDDRSRRRRNTLGFAPEGGRPKSRRKTKRAAQ